MPDVQEVFRAATQKVRPDPGALERQQEQQRRRTTRRRAGAYALGAALFAVIAVIAVRASVDPSKPKEPGAQPSSPTAAPDREPVGTVTSDGSTCSLEMTGQRIEAGIVLIEVVNGTDDLAMFDAWVLSEGFTFAAFEQAVRRDVRFAEEGEARGAWPSEEEVTHLRSDVIQAHSSESVAVPMSEGRHAITCLKPYEGLGFRPYGIAGPITVR